MSRQSPHPPSSTPRRSVTRYLAGLFLDKRLKQTVRVQEVTPHLNHSAKTISDVFETLAEADADEIPEPITVEDVNFNEDGRRYRVTVERGVDE